MRSARRGAGGRSEGDAWVSEKRKGGVALPRVIGSLLHHFALEYRIAHILKLS